MKPQSGCKEEILRGGPFQSWCHFIGEGHDSSFNRSKFWLAVVPDSMTVAACIGDPVPWVSLGRSLAEVDSTRTDCLQREILHKFAVNHPFPETHLAVPAEKAAKRCHM
jgi:hypothetical protein